MFGLFARKFFGSVNDRMVKSFSPIVDQINSLEGDISKLTDAQLKAKTTELKAHLKDGKTLDDILPEAFAVVREASVRTLKMRHFDVQLMGGLVLHSGKISEMKTGEGKTLVSTLAAYLNALTEKGVHIVTVNDYLAKRDSAWMTKIYEFLGLSVGCIVNELNDEERKAAYACDITYATNNELGFDYLRDNMKFTEEEMSQREHNFAIVDEVDSILIDEARTPLIISGPTDDNSDLYKKVDSLIPQLKEEHYQIEEKERSIFLNDAGTDAMEKLLKDAGMVAKESSIYDVDYIAIVHHVNQSLKAHKVFKNEIDYIVKDDQVIIIDEFTGRMQEGRRFSDGLHQALEAKEKVNIKNENQTLASITFQNYFRLYKKLSGMTGTASTEAVEFEEIYKLKVIDIPTNQQIMRIDEDDEIYKTEKEKYKSIIKVIQECHKRKQPMLVGTISIEKSEILSKLLKTHKLPHYVLNAKYHEQEATIISQAGIPGAITIATNMAGRGTDIMLGGNPEMMALEFKNDKDYKKKLAEVTKKVAADRKIVLDAGGLYVLSTERHESRRIDNQLRGRSGRQGDLGKSKFYLSLEDDLMRIFGSERLQSVLSTLGLKDDEAIFHPWITKTLAKAQNKVEQRNYEIRKNLLKYDDIVNEQRKVIFKRRRELMASNDLSEKISQVSNDLVEEVIYNHIPKNSYPDQWDAEGIENEFTRIYNLKLNIKSLVQKEGVSEAEIVEFANDNVSQMFKAKKEQHGEEIEKDLQKQIFLMTLDSEWKDHLLSLDKLRYSINLRAYAQKDPLMEYKREAFDLFEEMVYQIEEKVITRLSHAQITMSNEEEEAVKLNLLKKLSEKQKTFESRNDPALVGEDKTEKRFRNLPVKTKIKSEDRNPANPLSWGNIGRNEPCPCQSGKKYKHCHGSI